MLPKATHPPQDVISNGNRRFNKSPLPFVRITGIRKANALQKTGVATLGLQIAKSRYYLQPLDPKSRYYLKFVYLDP